MLNYLRIVSNGLKPRLQSMSLTRFSSTNRAEETKITVTNDGQTIVCWHPEQAFPYEHSRPIPKSDEILKEEESVLKIQQRIDGQNIYKGSGPTTEELQLLTFTPQRVWTKSKPKRFLPKPPHPRKGI